MERIKLMAGNFEKEKNITPEYVNNKMEHMLTAIYDVIEENEHRMRRMEKILFELQNGKSKE
jgi:hypothetical protein